MTSDTRTRFLLQEAGVRGVSLRLQGAWQELLSHADYPPVAQELLGESLAAAALLTGHIKIDGRLSVQLRSPGALRTLFAECTASGTVRGIAQLQDGQDAPRELNTLGDAALLAVTIENPGLDPREPQRYQSLLELRAASLAEALEDYFRQSEQLPTRLLLACDGQAVAGLMLQKLPSDEGDADGWRRASILFDTLSATELLATPSETLLHRLFHQEQPTLLDQRPLRFGCSCSRERVAGVLQSLGQEEAHAALEDGVVEVRCEFCGRRYPFTAADLAVLFEASVTLVEGPERLQ